MKRGTEHLLKFKLLMRSLDLEVWQCKGLLQSVWDFVSENCPAGDIGRFSPEHVAIGIGYGGDAATLWAALTARPAEAASAWIDAHPKFGWVVHDWAQHCENSVHAALARRGQRFWDGSMPNLNALGGGERKRVEALWAEQSRGGGELGVVHPSGLRVLSREEGRSGRADQADRDSPALAEPRLGQSLDHGQDARATGRTECGPTKAVGNTYGDTHGVTEGNTDPAEPSRAEPDLAKPNPAEAEPEPSGDSAVSDSAGAPRGTRRVAGAGPASMAGVLREVAPQAPSTPAEREAVLNELWRRVCRAARDGPDWRRWWSAVIRVLARSEAGIGELTALVEYAERCADPVRRARDGLGPLQRPGAWMSGELLKWARSAGVKLPELPGKDGT